MASNLPAQDNHIDKLSASLKDSMIIIIQEKIPSHAITDKATMFIKRNGERAVPRADLNESKIRCISSCIFALKSLQVKPA